MTLVRNKMLECWIVLSVLSQCFLKCKPTELESPGSLVKRTHNPGLTSDILNQAIWGQSPGICILADPLVIPVDWLKNKAQTSEVNSLGSLGQTQGPSWEATIWWERNQRWPPGDGGLVTGRRHVGADACRELEQELSRSCLFWDKEVIGADWLRGTDSWKVGLMFNQKVHLILV